MDVTELIERYQAHAVDYYRKPNGRATSEPAVIRSALRIFRAMCGGEQAEQVQPARLVQVRQAMLEQGISRRTANAYTSRILRAFEWACDPEQGLLPPQTIAPLKAIRPLKFGRSTARETQPVNAAPEQAIQAVLEALDHAGGPQREQQAQRRLAAMIRIQVGTAMRPGELCLMRPELVDRGHPDGLWRYRPPEHKTEHHGHERVIFIQPAEQAVLAAWMDANPTRAGRIFGPTVRAYRAQLARACRRAGVAEITPHQLRHTAATTLARHYPLRTVGGILGHASTRTTEIYAKQTAEETAMAILRTGHR